MLHVFRDMICYLYQPLKIALRLCELIISHLPSLKYTGSIPIKYEESKYTACYNEKIHFGLIIQIPGNSDTSQGLEGGGKQDTGNATTGIDTDKSPTDIDNEEKTIEINTEMIVNADTDDSSVPSGLPFENLDNQGNSSICGQSRPDQTCHDIITSNFEKSSILEPNGLAQTCSDIRNSNRDIACFNHDNDKFNVNSKPSGNKRFGLVDKHCRSLPTDKSRNVLRLNIPNNENENRSHIGLNHDAQKTNSLSLSLKSRINHASRDVLPLVLLARASALLEKKRNTR